MKRPPGLWLLLTIVAVWLKVDDVYSLKATALIFGKTSTTTTTTTVPDVSGSASEEGVTETSSVESDGQNSTKPQLTGNPQIDYIWDPNLPRELNGYNLSEYPFYDRLPKDIDFKCDGLHDGFYASVPHKCQVYHHCLFGVRYDFLCANYTAFDQKTFICHFVSEVDCVNSKKFWHRNDALYQAASTTTVKPSPIYTLPPPVSTAIPIVPILSRRPERPRRPPARRRPYDYYEDEYEEDDYYEKPMRRPQRPRYRPRVYDEEYEYEEDDYARRPSGRRNENRRPYKSRGPNRRRPYDDEEYQDEDETRRPDGNRRNNDDTRRPSKRRPIEDDEYDRRTYDRPRKKGNRRPIDEEYEDAPPPRRSSDRRKNSNREDSRKYEDEVEEDRPRKSSRKSNDRNRNDEPVEEDTPRNRNDNEKDRDRNRNDESAGDDRSNKNRERNKNDDTSNDDGPLPKPPTSIYNRRRPMISKVRPPVPSHEQAKYSPKVPKNTTPQPTDEEYYDDYEEEVEKKGESRRPYKDNNRKSASPIQSSTKRGYENKRKEDDYEADVEVDTTTRRYNKRPLYNDEGFGNKERRNNSNNRRRPVLPEYEDNEETNDQVTRNKDRKISTTTTTTTTKEPPREAVVKVVKRPFLPSRGGSPYASRGLLPVGSKASEAPDADENNPPEIQNSRNQGEQLENNESPKQAPVSVKIPIRNKYANNDEEFRPISSRPLTRIIKLTTTTTTERPKVIEKDPLDEYDVTLNDALNPTLPNLPVRSFPTGFSSQNDYTYNTVQRPRYVIDPIINQASSDYVYRIEQPEAISNNIRYRSIPVYQNFRQSPKVTQAFYSPY